MGCAICRQLLSDGLDLCVRARKMDAMDRRENTLAISADPDSWIDSGRFDEHVARNNIYYPHQPLSTRSGTVPLWLNEQYDRDLLAWEEKSRVHLMQGCEND